MILYYGRSRSFSLRVVKALHSLLGRWGLLSLHELEFTLQQKNTAEEGYRTDIFDSRQELGMLAGSQASLPEPIPRPGLDFEKSCERLAGLEIADRAMGMRLHIPEKKIPKF
jgi:hypothetical protein